MMSSLLRTAFIVLLAFGSMHVLAEQITCESRGGRAEACSTLVPGSSVQLVQQISNSPCIEGSTWSAANDSLWVSRGCRAVFDVQAPYRGVNSSYDEDRYDRSRYYSSGYSGGGNARRIAANACVNRVTDDQAIDADDIGTNNVRRVSTDLFVVDLNTPRGAVACSVDRYGTVRNINYRY